MSGTLRDRAGQVIGALTVLADRGRTKAGKVLWRVWDNERQRERYLRTEGLIRLDRRSEVADIR